MNERRDESKRKKCKEKKGMNRILSFKNGA